MRVYKIAVLATFASFALSALGEPQNWNPPTLFDSADFSHVSLTQAGTSVAFVAGVRGHVDGSIVEGDSLGKQTTKALTNLSTILESLGATPKDVIRIHIFVTSYHQMKGMSVARRVRKFFDGDMPVSSFIPIQSLPEENARVQIDAVVQLPKAE